MIKYICGMAICGIFLVLSIFPFCAWLVFYSYDLNQVPYYANDDNYISFESSVESFYIYEDCINIMFSTTPEEFYDGFRLSGKNFDLAVSNGVFDILEKGTVLTVTAAPKYLGDGWKYPIAELVYNGTKIVPYAEGKANVVEERQEADNVSRKYITILGSICGVLVALEILFIVLFYKSIHKPKVA